MKPLHSASAAARREAHFVIVTWILACAYTVGFSYFAGYGKPAPPRLWHGIPTWVVWGVLLPWFVTLAVTLWFAGWRMTDEPLGENPDEVPESV